ncbi:MAG: hypothetical protein ACFFKA_15960, partial [Candidatus Thorarchaeota archaeon]
MRKKLLTNIRNPIERLKIKSNKSRETTIENIKIAFVIEILISGLISLEFILFSSSSTSISCFKTELLKALTNSVSDNFVILKWWKLDANADF